MTSSPSKATSISMLLAVVVQELVLEGYSGAGKLPASFLHRCVMLTKRVLLLFITLVQHQSPAPTHVSTLCQTLDRKPVCVRM